MTPRMAAYNAAVDAQTLQSGRDVPEARSLLVAEGLVDLADRYGRAYDICHAAEVLYREMLGQRPTIGIVAELFDDARAEIDAGLEALIVAHKTVIDMACARLAAVQTEVDAVADTIVARVPGADQADTSIA